ncbi:MAG: slipin family protein [Ectobacillus sp.]
MLEKMMMIVTVFLLSAGGIWVLWAIWNKLFSTYTIHEYERGVKFHKGKFSGLVGPGKYTYLNSAVRLEVFDMRSTILLLNGQELLSADNISVKVSLAVRYQIVDPQTLLSHHENFHNYLYMAAQLKIREVVSSLQIDEVLSNRKLINNRFRELMLEDGSLAGLVIQSADVKDIMVSAELKKVFAEALKAKKEALASLEKARGEIATLRSLANAAKMMEKNPELMKLRFIHVMESSQGNTFVVDTNQIKEARGEK